MNASDRPLRPDEVDVIARAQALADDRLFPRALEVDTSNEVPISQLQLLVDAGLYGITSGADGREPFSAHAVGSVIEALASGCLTTAFVWTQHLGAARGAWDAGGVVRASHADDLATGRSRGGVAFAHMLRSGPPLTTVVATADGWLLNGSAPWVTGWGHIDLVHVAARHGDDIVWALLDAQPSASLHSEVLTLAALNASSTVTLAFVDHPVPADRVTAVLPFTDWRRGYDKGLRTNGSFALGLAKRCCIELGPSPLDDELVRCRHRLDTVSQQEMPGARAEASALAVRSAAALVAHSGGRAITMQHHAQRLAREAHFLLVQGQTPAIRQHLLTAFGAASPG